MTRIVTSESTAIALHLRPKQLFYWMMIAITSLILASVLGQFSYAQWPDVPGVGLIARVTDVDAERSFPTAYSSLALLACSLLQGTIACVPSLSSPSKAHRWRALALIFLYLSTDELLGFHELAIEPLREALNLSGVFYFAWVLPAGILVALFVLSFFRFWLSLPAYPRALFLRAILLFVGGAIGVEMINGAYFSQWGDTWTYIALLHLEEFLEMWGIATLIQGLFSYICIRLNRDRIILHL